MQTWGEHTCHSDVHDDTGGAARPKGDEEKLLKVRRSNPARVPVFYYSFVGGVPSRLCRSWKSMGSLVADNSLGYAIKKQ